MDVHYYPDREGFQSSPTIATLREKSASNGKCLHVSSRLVINYLIIN